MVNPGQLSEVVRTIVTEQRIIIGPLAVDQANKVTGVQISADLQSVKVEGEAKVVLEGLVMRYERLFGRASVEVCREAVKMVMHRVSADDLPEVLR